MITVRFRTDNIFLREYFPGEIDNPYFFKKNDTEYESIEVWRQVINNNPDIRVLLAGNEGG